MPEQIIPSTSGTYLLVIGFVLNQHWLLSSIFEVRTSFALRVSFLESKITFDSLIPLNSKRKSFYVALEISVRNTNWLDDLLILCCLKCWLIIIINKPINRKYIIQHLLLALQHFFVTQFTKLKPTLTCNSQQ